MGKNRNKHATEHTAGAPAKSPLGAGAMSKTSDIKGVKQLNGLQYFVVELPRPMAAKSDGGIVMVSDEKSKDDWARYGRIVAIGDGSILPDGEHHACKYAVGEHVLMDRFTAQTVVCAKHVRLVPERNIFCTVDPDVIEGDDDWRPGS